LDLATDYFDLFNIPRGFDVDLPNLAQQYRRLQQQFHPDKFAGNSAQQKRLAEQYTALFNQAFVTLKDPLARAQYLLSLKGIDGAHENTTHQDSEFLFEQMELRESLSAVRESNSPFEVLEQLTRLVADRYAELQGKFAMSYNDDDLEGARELVAKMQFFNKLSREIAALEAELEDSA